MSEAFKDGGPAYPMADPFVVSTPKNVDEAQRLAKGMSRREHFAGLAMQAFLSGHVSHYGHENPWPYDAMASEAYDVADAMLRARAKGGES